MDDAGWQVQRKILRGRHHDAERLSGLNNKSDDLSKPTETFLQMKLRKNTDPAIPSRVSSDCIRLAHQLVR